MVPSDFIHDGINFGVNARHGEVKGLQGRVLEAQGTVTFLTSHLSPGMRTTNALGTRGNYLNLGLVVRATLHTWRSEHHCWRKSRLSFHRVFREASSGCWALVAGAGSAPTH